MKKLLLTFAALFLFTAQTCEPPQAKDKKDTEKAETTSDEAAEDSKDDVKTDVEEEDEKDEKSDENAPPTKSLKLNLELDGIPAQHAQLPETNIVLTTPYGVSISKNTIRLNEGKNFWLVFEKSDVGLSTIFQSDGVLACNASRERTFSEKQLAFMKKSCETMREVTPEEPTPDAAADVPDDPLEEVPDASPETDE